MPIGVLESIKLLQPAIDREADVSIEWLLTNIRQGRFQLWKGEGSAIVTNVADAGNGKHLVWLFAGGDLQEITKELKPQIENWAKSIGCQRASMTARVGWSKVLKDYKKRQQFVLVKEFYG